MHSDEIGLVLYTVRDRAEKDFEGTLRETAAIGYGCAEICGTFGMEAARLRELGDELGLRLPSAHVGLGDLIDKYDATAGYYAAVGVEALVLPWLDETLRNSVEATRKTAKLLGQIGARLKARGISLLFHHHDVEFKPIGGTTAWDVLVAESDPAGLGFEVDV
jgi:sugar phosphate isomerase/epimerase